jgi:hypothetical protein
MLKSWSRMAVFAVIVVAVSGLVAASASASRGATRGQRTALTQAVHASSVAGLNRIPRSHYRVTNERISTVSNSWAKADLVARPAYVSSFQNAIVVAVRLAGTSRWVVVDLGSSDVGCGIAPNKVLEDLFKTSRPCPSGGIG